MYLRKIRPRTSKPSTSRSYYIYLHAISGKARYGCRTGTIIGRQGVNLGPRDLIEPLAGHRFFRFRFLAFSCCFRFAFAFLSRTRWR